jgi:glycosyltransferase involved in cell wall biosynthesis
MNQLLPALTVVIPNFNHGHVIGDQLRAIFAQSVQPAKILIVDDASTDDSVNLIRQLIRGRSNTELICKSKNSGVIAVLNESLLTANTDYITFPAADDVVLQGLFEKSLIMLKRYPEAGLCSSISYVQDESGTSIIPNRLIYPISTPTYFTPERVFTMLLRGGSWFMGNTTVFRREALLSAGGFNPELYSFTDGFVSLVLALRHGAVFIPEPLAIWRRSDAGYAGIAVSDHERARKILTAAQAQMSAEFKDIFTSDLIARSNARLLYQLLSARLARYEYQVRDLVNTARPATGSKLFLIALSVSIRLFKTAILLTLRFRDIPWAVISKLWQWKFNQRSNKS